jgi:hypothetical protein
MIVLASQLLSGIPAPQPYLDPGSGSILLQLLLAALLGIGIFVRSQWSKIKAYFKGRDVSAEDTDDDE